MTRIARARQGCPFFFFNDTATTEIYTLSLHDALPISLISVQASASGRNARFKTKKSPPWCAIPRRPVHSNTSEQHTSQLQPRPHTVCRHLRDQQRPWNKPPAAIVVTPKVTTRGNDPNQ